MKRSVLKRIDRLLSELGLATRSTVNDFLKRNNVLYFKEKHKPAERVLHAAKRVHPAFVDIPNYNSLWLKQP